MRCEQIQEELMLNFGVEAVSPEIESHLKQCTECRAVKESLDNICPSVLSDQDFRLSDDATREIQENVEKSIVPRPIFSVQRLMAIAASVVLVVGAAYVGYKSIGSDDPLDLLADGTADTIAETVDWLTDSDSPSIDELFESVNSDQYRSSYELLLEEITDDDLDYLENNLSAGELL